MIKQKQLKYKDILHKILIYSITIFVLSGNIYANISVKCKKYKEITVKQPVTLQECIDNIQILRCDDSFVLVKHYSGRLFDNEFDFILSTNCNNPSVKMILCSTLHDQNYDLVRSEKIAVCEEWEIEEGDIKEFAREVIKALPNKVIGKLYDPNLIYE